MKSVLAKPTEQANKQTLIEITMITIGTESYKIQKEQITIYHNFKQRKSI